MGNIIDLAVQEANEAYDNSNAQEVNLVVEHQQQIDFNESNSIVNDRNNLITRGENDDLPDPNDEADVVVLLAETGSYDANGIAGSIRLREDSAYAVIDVSAATGPGLHPGPRGWAPAGRPAPPRG